jgi:C1A family cysteine protease
MDIKKKLGWRRPLPSPKPFKFTAMAGVALPNMVDLQPLCPPVYDQDNLGSCTANAAGGLCQFVMHKAGHKWFVPSRLANYYWTRIVEGTAPNDDAGASVQDAVATCHNVGCANEGLYWWYNIAKFSVKPSHVVIADANKHQIAQPLAVNHFSLSDMQSCLSQGFPFALGFTVYQSFEQGNWDSTTGMMPMPARGEKILGGHAVLAVGYDNVKQAFKIRNSWGNWGLGGYFWMPFSFVTSGNYVDDLWTCHGFSSWTN